MTDIAYIMEEEPASPGSGGYMLRKAEMVIKVYPKILGCVQEDTTKSSTVRL